MRETRRMSGMDMGVSTRLGSFGSFTVSWALMMVAMMLPGATPATVRRARATGRLLAAPLFAASYLAVWVAAGLAVYALDRPHGTVAAGVAAIAAGGYELTPIKRNCRRMCEGTVRVALALAGLGILIITVPSAIPGLLPTMTVMRPV